MSHRIESAQIFHSLGLNVFLFDYRGYGMSSGTPSEEQTYEDASAAWRYLIDIRGIPESDIIILGRSMGGPIAAKLAKDHNPVLVILESTFTSIPDIGKSRFPIFPTKLLVKIHYPTIDYIKEIQAPILIVHSRDDEIVPYWMGEMLFENANSPKEFVALSGGHNETYFECIDKYKANLERAIKKYLL
jgi:pimeloyl-ACP methyl ester carboxylesterase